MKTQNTYFEGSIRIQSYDQNHSFLARRVALGWSAVCVIVIFPHHTHLLFVCFDWFQRKIW